MKQQYIFFVLVNFIFSSLLITSVGWSQDKSVEIQFTNSKGEKLFTYKTADKIFIKLKYPAKNVDPTKIDLQSAIITSEIEPDGEVITLTETSESSGVFTGSISVRESPMPFPQSSFLEIAKGDKLMAKFHLPQNEQGIEKLIFDNAYYQGPDWTFVNTGANHIVLLAPDIVITIDGEPAENGIFVSAFYEKMVDGNVVLENGGGSGRGIAPGGVRWIGQVTVIALWGTQDAKNNGFAEGDNFVWKVWRPSDGKVFDAIPTYITNDTRITHTDTYTKDGISGLKALTVSTKNK